MRDILAAPERLDACLDAYAGRSPLDDVVPAGRAVFIGMGSSRFAALPAAAFCLTFRATLAVVHLLAGRLTDAGPGVDDMRPAVAAAAALRDSRDLWLGELADRVAEATTTYLIAPEERLSSARQSALMLREGPRLPADATETGDWLHVDVYLSKRPGYTALLFPGSRFDGDVMDYASGRGSTIVAVGRDVPGAVQVIPVESATAPFVPLLVETGVAELGAGELWRRGVTSGDPALQPPRR